MHLPQLDFSKFTHGSHKEQVELAEALVDSFKNHGFVTLINHGIPEQVVKDYQRVVKCLFQ